MNATALASLRETIGVSADRPHVRWESVEEYQELGESVEELKREPIPDADAECPRCGAREWLLVERRAEREEPFTRWRALGCARCDATDGWRGAGRARPGRRDELYDDWEDERVAGLPDAPTPFDLARVAPFPVLGCGDAPTLRRYSYERGRITGVSVAAGELVVTTSTAREIPPSFQSGAAECAARRVLERSLTDRTALFDSPLSAPARELALAEQDRRAREQAAAAEVREVTFEVDGTPHVFVLAVAGARWAAAARVGAQTVTVSGIGRPPPGVTLRRLPLPGVH